MKTLHILLSCVFLLPFFSCTETPFEPAPPVDRTVTNATGSFFTYAGNGNTRGDVPARSEFFKTGAEVTLLSNLGNMTKPDVSFYGWNTRSDGSGLDYLPGSTFVMPASNVVVHAKWLLFASGGDYTYVSGTYKYHIFSNTGSSTLTINVSGVIDVLVVAGGGINGGGGGSIRVGGSGIVIVR